MRLERVNGSAIAVFLVAAVFAFPGTASAFDTGPHFDITADVLKSEGFSPNAIEIVQTGNFLVDFHEFMGSGGLKTALDPLCRMKVTKALINGDAQHFDDLEDTREVAEKWDALLDGTIKTADAKVKRPQGPDLLGLLVLLGMSLHNVQDFYAHSNWVEDSPSGPGIGKGGLAKYGDHPTWLSVDRAEREQLDVYTRRTRKSPRRTHGAWDSNKNGSKPDSLNKDWSGRPKHDDAYICAYFATRQWVRLYRTWVNNPVVWNLLQQYRGYNPSYDHYAAEKISFYGGHWNGNGSGYSLKEMRTSYAAATSPDLMIKEVLSYLDASTCLTSGRTKLRAEAQSLLETWGEMKYNGPVNPTLPSPAPENLRFVQLKVHRIDNINGDDGKLGGEMDWFSYSEIAGQKYMSGLIDEHDNFDFDIRPYYPWTMTKAVAPNTDSVLMTLKLMELDYVNDDVVDIDPDTNQKTLVFRWKVATGQFTGDITGTGNVVSKGAGDCDCAQVVVSANSMAASCLK